MRSLQFLACLLLALIVNPVTGSSDEIIWEPDRTGMEEPLLFREPTSEDPLANAFEQGQENWQRRQEIAKAFSEGRRYEFRDCPECPEMVVIPDGAFQMGNPRASSTSDEWPVHRIAIPRPFAVGKYEVTQSEWVAMMGHNPSRFKGDRNPVEQVNWDEAKEFANRLSAKTGKTYRLLSEAEWEYAARAGTRTCYWWGNDPGRGNANCNGCGSQWDNRATAPVGSFRPNAFGLYDTAGNVWEWVEDCHHRTYHGAPTDGSVWTPPDCDRHVLRGGAWNNNPTGLCSTNRNATRTNLRNGSLGLRVVRVL